MLRPVRRGHRQTGSSGRKAGSTAVACSLLGQRIRFDCTNADAARVLHASYGAALEVDPHAGPDIHYVVESTPGQPAFRLRREGAAAVVADDRSELLAFVDRDLTVELQRRRNDLFFLHAAALERHGGAWLFAAPSGTGKSTLAFALLHRGFRYMSDELAPIDVGTMSVHPYPRALCLKHPLPESGPREWPPETIDLVDALHVPARSLPGGSPHEAVPVRGLLLLERAASSNEPRLRRLGTAEATASLYANALNALAHPNRGLDAALAIAMRLHCFALTVSDLDATCRLVLKTVAEPAQPGASRTR